MDLPHDLGLVETAYKFRPFGWICARFDHEFWTLFWQIAICYAPPFIAQVSMYLQIQSYYSSNRIYYKTQGTHNLDQYLYNNLFTNTMYFQQKLLVVMKTRYLQFLHLYQLHHLLLNHCMTSTLHTVTFHQ